eukprot:CAMPEP_0119413210 /NCGR_PEP_ID=MMETSP1335-20130426/5370_1 /TAXON_ID=259385 /ORGANISM="Chrysoculter rhomboideus, Strain RCC1486" /LENGTH=264 /DNA_ID=CAMNT_0007437991 /DNA_START=44 /DNA_END=834 /DNA_ORIENTATION=+
MPIFDRLKIIVQLQSQSAAALAPNIIAGALRELYDCDMRRRVPAAAGQVVVNLTCGCGDLTGRRSDGLDLTGRSAGLEGHDADRGDDRDSNEDQNAERVHHLEGDRVELAVVPNGAGVQVDRQALGEELARDTRVSHREDERVQRGQSAHKRDEQRGQAEDEWVLVIPEEEPMRRDHVRLPDRRRREQVDRDKAIPEAREQLELVRPVLAVPLDPVVARHTVARGQRAVEVLAQGGLARPRPDPVAQVVVLELEQLEARQQPHR